MSEGSKIGPNTGWVFVLIAVVVAFGLGTSLLSDDFGSPSRLDELGAEYSDGRATIEVLVRDDGTGTFSAKALATCGEGTVVRRNEGRTATSTWTDDEYRCDSGSFVVRTEWPTDEADTSTETRGTWTITGGADDYGDMVGGGTATMATGPGEPDLLTGTIGYDY